MEKILYLLNLLFIAFKIYFFPWIIFSCFRLLRKKFDMKLFYLSIPFFLFLITMQVFPYLARVNIKNILDEHVLYVSCESCSFIDNTNLHDSLKNLSHVIGRNTSPIDKYLKIVIVTDKKRKELYIKPDAHYKGRFWLYDPEYSFSKINNIGYLVIKN